MAGTFFSCALSYAIGTAMGPASSILSLVLMSAAVPAACILLAIAVPWTSDIIGYAPVFYADLSLDMLGDAPHLSLLGVFDIIQPASAGLSGGPDRYGMALSCILSGTALLSVGCYTYERRDA